MRKKIIFLITPLLAIIISCNLGNRSKLDENETNRENPVNVTVGSGSLEYIESYRTSVRMVTEDSRLVGKLTEENLYTISAKMIDNEIVTRIDYPVDSFDDGIARSTIINKNYAYHFKTYSNELEFKMEIDSPEQTQAFDIVGKIENFSAFKTKLYDMSENIEEDSKAGILSANIRENDINFTVRYDLNEEIYLGSEFTTYMNDGTKVTTKTEYLYQEVNEVLLKVGEVATSTYDLDKIYEPLDSDTLIIDSEDEVEEITEEELKELYEEGYQINEISPIIGDPTDPDFTKTAFYIYEDIEFNNLDDELFKVLW